MNSLFGRLRDELQVMQEQGVGHIVSTASDAGLRGVPGLAPYVASKHAVVGLSEIDRSVAEYMREMRKRSFSDSIDKYFRLGRDLKILLEGGDLFGHGLHRCSMSGQIAFNDTCRAHPEKNEDRKHGDEGFGERIPQRGLQNRRGSEIAGQVAWKRGDDP